MERLDDWNPFALYFKFRRLRDELRLIDNVLSDPQKWVQPEATPAPRGWLPSMGNALGKAVRR